MAKVFQNLGIHNGAGLDCPLGFLERHPMAKQIGQLGSHFQFIGGLADGIGRIQSSLEQGWQQWPLLFHQVAENQPLPAILDEVPCWIIPWDFNGLATFCCAAMLDGSQKCSCVGSREAQVTSVW